LGDIHRHQEVGKKGSNVFYSGSVNRIDFSEVEDKGVLLVYIDDKDFIIEEVKFITLTKPRRIKTVVYNNESDCFVDAVTGEIVEDDGGNKFDDIKVRVHIDEQDRESKRKLLEVIERKANALCSGKAYIDVKVKPIENVRTELYKTSITLQEKAITYLDLNEIVIDDIDDFLSKLSMTDIDSTATFLEKLEETLKGIRG